ncbi:MAG: head-tail connector protein [Saprospiraceae bacterium]
MQLALVTPPAGAVISLADAKLHLRVEHNAEDAYIPLLVDTAEALVAGRDGWTGRALMPQTWRLTLNAFPEHECLRLPLPPLVSVSSVTYYDAANALQTFNAADYSVLANDTPGRIELNALASWPVTYRRPDAVQVVFSCGYASAAAVPPAIRQAALIVLAALYANRGDDGSFRIPPAVRHLLGAQKCWGPDDWQ